MQKIFIMLIINFILISNLSSEIKSFDTYIKKVIDGDTIITGEDIKVRFACVDTFESKYNKRSLKQAEKYNISQKEVINKGLEQKKYLESFTKSYITIYYNDDSSKNDIYGRLIGVAVTNDGVVLNIGNPYMNKTNLCKEFGL